MPISTNQIFCDEAGFTGDNMIDPEQPYFVFSALNVGNEDSYDLIQHVYTDFGLQGTELKGRNLIKHRNGQNAILWLLDRCEENLMLTINHKAFSLACRFFEW